MAFEFTCPACQGLLRVEETATGGLIRCGACQTLLRVPDAVHEANEVEPRPSSSSDPLAQRAEPPADYDDRPRPPAGGDVGPPPVAARSSGSRWFSAGWFSELAPVAGESMRSYPERTGAPTNRRRAASGSISPLLPSKICPSPG